MSAAPDTRVSALREAAFDDARTKILGDAYDAVWHRLHGTNYPIGVREVIACRVIQIMRMSGEGDPERLADKVVLSLGIRL